MKAAVCGMGLVGGFGRGAAALEAALGGKAVVPATVTIPTREGAVSVPCLRADTAPLADHVAPQVLRRMNHYIRLGLLAAIDAMADAAMLDDSRRGRLGVIVATGHGATGNNYAFEYPFEGKEEICGSPTRFSNSVHNAVAAYISIVLKEMGPNHSITHEDISFPSALLTAVTWLGQGRVDAVLVGGVDELNHAHAYAWHVSQQGAGSAPGNPPAGEGACFFVLKAPAAAIAPYALIRDVGLGRDVGGRARRPVADCYILGRGGLGATPADYAPWLPRGARHACYARIYGDLSVDSAFDTAIAVLSRKNGRFYGDRCGFGTADGSEPLSHRTLACLKLGVGDTYGWTLFD